MREVKGPIRKRDNNKFRKLYRDYFRERNIPYLYRAIKYSQMDFKSINRYINQFSSAHFDHFIYPGAKEDFRLNCSTKYMKDLTEEQREETHKQVEILLKKDSGYTSRIAILHNYAINEYADSKLLKKVIKVIMDSNTRFTIMLITRDNSLDYDIVKNIMQDIKISDWEMEYLWRYLFKILENNGQDFGNPEISNVCNLIKDFYVM